MKHATAGVYYRLRVQANHCPWRYGEKRMKKGLVVFLLSRMQGRPVINIFEPEEPADSVMEGAFVCQSCKTWYPITDGVLFFWIGATIYWDVQGFVKKWEANLILTITNC